MQQRKTITVKIKGYHHISLKSLIDSHFDSYAICCMTSLKIMVPNAILEVPKFEIEYANYSSTKLQFCFLIKFDQYLENTLIETNPNKYFSIPNQEN